jgi:hypothetical protein
MVMIADRICAAIAPSLLQGRSGAAAPLRCDFP